MTTTTTVTAAVAAAVVDTTSLISTAPTPQSFLCPPVPAYWQCCGCGIINTGLDGDCSECGHMVCRRCTYGGGE